MRVERGNPELVDVQPCEYSWPGQRSATEAIRHRMGFLNRASIMLLKSSSRSRGVERARKIRSLYNTPSLSISAGGRGVSERHLGVSAHPESRCVSERVPRVGVSAGGGSAFGGEPTIAGGAGDGSRTHTGLTAHRILSPERLPVPPPRRRIAKLEIEDFRNVAAKKGKEVSEGRQLAGRGPVGSPSRSRPTDVTVTQACESR
jgi:hypothetical protein